MRLLAAIALTLCFLPCSAQELQTAYIKNGILLTVPAQKYQLLPGQERTPQLGVQCIHKGKKSLQVVIFLPGGSLVSDNPEAGNKAGEMIAMSVKGEKIVVPWVGLNEDIGFAYTPTLQAEQLLHSLLESQTVSLEFRPFLTGTPITSTFDVHSLHEVLSHHPECVAQQ